MMLRSVRTLLLLGATSVLAGHVAERPDRSVAWPHFVMIRGGGLERTVLLHRSNSALTSPIDGLYAALHTISQPQSQSLGGRYYEVAEFWFEPWTSLVGEDGKPVREVQFSEGTYFSRIYPDATDGPVWDPYLPRRTVDGQLDQLRDGRRSRFVGILEPGKRILEAHGLRFGSN